MNKNIVIITRSLVGFGGIPYSLRSLAIGWAKNEYVGKYKLTYIILENLNSKLSEEINNSGVSIKYINKLNRISQFNKIRETLREYKDSEYFICTCFRTYYYAKLLAPKGSKVIFWFRGANILNKTIKSLFFNITNSSFSITNSYFTAQSNQLSDFRVLYNGVDDSFLNMPSDDFYEKFNIPKNSFCIGYVAGWNEGKNHSTLVKAFGIIAEKLSNAYLICIGEQTGLTDQILQNAVQKDRIKIIGKLTFASRYLKYLDVYVHPSFNEGFGNAVIEAMLSKCAVIVSNSGALPEIIDNGNTGFVVKDPLSAEEWAGKIVELYASKDLQKVKTNAFEAAQNSFNPQKFAKNLREIL